MIFIKIFLLLSIISPVQLPLHEPYFDFTLIRVTHTKSPILKNKSYVIYSFLIQNSKLIAHTPFSMWRVVSTNPKLYSPCHGDPRLLAISYSYSRVSDYNPYLILSYFGRLAKIHILASLCLGTCGTSIAHNIKAMRTCLDPFYHNPYTGELLYFIFYK